MGCFRRTIFSGSMSCSKQCPALRRRRDRPFPPQWERDGICAEGSLAQGAKQGSAVRNVPTAYGGRGGRLALQCGREIEDCGGWCLGQGSGFMVIRNG